MQIQAVSRTRKWSCRVTAVAELLTGGGGGGGGEARPAALPRYSRGSTRQAHGATPASTRQQTSRPRPPVHLLRGRPARLVRGGLAYTTQLGSWGRCPAPSCWLSWPSPAPGPLSCRHHDGGDRPVPGAHRALGDAAAGEGAGGEQARAGRERRRGRGRESGLGDCEEGAPSDGATRALRTHREGGGPAG